MNKEEIERLLKDVKRNKITVNKALEQLKDYPFVDMNFAKIDLHRNLRQGFPEVIYCEGKTEDSIIAIIEKMVKNKCDVLATHASKDLFLKVKKRFKNTEFNGLARIVTLRVGNKRKGIGKILVITAGTADIPVAEEARVTSQMCGSLVKPIYDVGVAGIHRLINYRDSFKNARAIIVVAGMEGALASVVGGMVNVPVIGVPTSVGYGANFRGVAPLLTMLNSCSANVSVVNIDNGFGAGIIAHLINKRSSL